MSPLSSPSHVRTTRAAATRAAVRPPIARDAVVTAVALGLTLSVMAGAHGSPGPTASSPRGIDALGVALAAVACLPLLAHRRWALGAFAVSVTASATINALGYGLGPPFGATAALFYVAVDQDVHERLRLAGPAVVALATLHVGATALSERGFPTIPILGATVLWGGAWIAGDHVRQRRQRLADQAERASRVQRDAERETRLAVAEERTRIARDLHDSAAHAINVILVQAGGARLLLHSDTDAVQGALQTIEDVARETISDIDRLIRGLREERDPGAAGDRGGVEPPAGLAALDTLAERHRAAGLPVQVDVDGPLRPLAPGLDQAAYRILQESLTNAARHGCGPARVRIAYGDAELELTVANPRADRAGPHRAPDAAGHGLQGMRERAALLGGSLAVDEHDGAFRVRASLPYVEAGVGAR